MCGDRKISFGKIAGRRIGRRIRLIGETMTAQSDKKERLAFWLEVAQSVTEAIDECTEDDNTAATRH